MDLGIKGRWALVCAASKGLGKGCALALAGEGVNLVITARGAEALEATAQQLRQIAGAGKVVAVAGDITTADGARGRTRRVPAGRHPRQQRGGSAAGRLSRLAARRLDQGGRRQHADADRADQGHGRPDGRARLRPRGQHHLGCGEGADRRAGFEQRRAQRPHRFRRRAGAAVAPGVAQRHDQQPAARHLRHRPHPAPRSRARPPRPASRSTS